jgi:hypothetical protein
MKYLKEQEKAYEFAVHLIDGFIHRKQELDEEYNLAFNDIIMYVVALEEHIGLDKLETIELNPTEWADHESYLSQGLKINHFRLRGAPENREEELALGWIKEEHCKNPREEEK